MPPEAYAVATRRHAASEDFGLCGVSLGCHLGGVLCAVGRLRRGRRVACKSTTRDDTKAGDPGGGPGSPRASQRRPKGRRRAGSDHRERKEIRVASAGNFLPSPVRLRDPGRRLTLSAWPPLPLGVSHAAHHLRGPCAPCVVPKARLPAPRGLLGLALRRVSACGVLPPARSRAPGVARVLAEVNVPRREPYRAPPFHLRT